MKREFVSIWFILMLFLSMLLCSVPLVKATIYPDGYPYFDFPPDYYLECDITGGGGGFRDGEVNIFDVVFVATRYESKEGDGRYDWRADFNDDGVIDIYDLTYIAGKYGEGEPVPVAYSTRFEFTVPDDGDTEVCYYIQVKFYVPSALDGKWLRLTGSVDDYDDDYVQGLWIDHEYWDGWDSGSLNLSLGYCSQGFHLLEFEYIEYIGGGHLNFRIATSYGEEAWLVRFRIHVADYSDAEYGYTVKTHTNFPIDDEYFLFGYADDYIDDVYVDGLKWQDWAWDVVESRSLYACEDGFCYPLGERVGPRDITFIFGEIWGGGLLDFRYVAWTDQREYWLKAPKFRALGYLCEADDINLIINRAMFYGGSKWKFEADPQFSERYFEARQTISANHYGDCWFRTSFEVGLGLGWAEWALLPGTEDDVGITLNLTCNKWNSDHGMEYPWFWTLRFRNTMVDIYSFPALEIKGIEYEEHDSFVKSDLTSAIDFTGTVIMFVSGALEQPLGAVTGLCIKGIAAYVKINQGQDVSNYETKLSKLHHYQLKRKYSLVAWATVSEGSELRDDSDVVFFKLSPAAGHHCGSTLVVLQGLLEACEWKVSVSGVLLVRSFPIADIIISICIPWFLRG